jgi:catechol 2,3-dioxygenase-like lactoylglutathione lyase family enzyme
MKRLFACGVWCAAAAFGQVTPGAAPAGAVLGPGNFIHAVSNLDRSIAFYHDVLGLDLPGGAKADAPHPYLTKAEILSMFGAVGGQWREQPVGIQESPVRADLIEFKDVGSRAVQPRISDPGASNFVLTVRDIDAVMERVKKSGTPVVTRGGAPVDIVSDRGKARAVVVSDPDGFFVELAQPETLPANAARSSNNVIDIGIVFTVESTDRMARLFKDALGFEPKSAAFQSDKAHLDLFGVTAGAQFLLTTAQVPGSAVQIGFNEFKGVDRKPVQGTPHDPGAGILRLRVRDMDSMVKNLAAGGVKVVSAGGEPVLLTLGNNTSRYAAMGFPDNLFVQIVQQLPGAP